MQYWKIGGPVFLDLTNVSRKKTNACGTRLVHAFEKKLTSGPWSGRVLAPPQGPLPCWILLIIEDIERDEARSAKRAKRRAAEHQAGCCQEG